MDQDIEDQHNTSEERTVCLVAVPITQIEMSKASQQQFALKFGVQHKRVNKNKLKEGEECKEIRRVRRKRVCWKDVNEIKVFFPLRENIYFRISGDISIFIKKIDDENHPQFRTIVEVEDNGWFMRLEGFSSKCLVEFSFVIYLLEKSQCSKKYQMAQYLKGFQQYSSDVHKKLRNLAEEYKENKDEYDELIKERNEYKKNMIKEYISKILKPEEFFYVIEQSANYKFDQLSARRFFISKSLFALIGLEDNEIVHHLLRRGISQYTFLNDREQFFLDIMETYVENSQEYKHCKNFQLITNDGIQIFCDAFLLPVKIQIPKQFHFSRSKDLKNPKFESFLIIKYDIRAEHINQVLNYRNQLLPTQGRQPIYYQSSEFEYSMLSSIFIDKFYSQSQIQ